MSVTCLALTVSLIELYCLMLDAAHLDRTLVPVGGLEPSPLKFQAAAWSPAGCSSTGGYDSLAQDYVQHMSKC